MVAFAVTQERQAWLTTAFRHVLVRPEAADANKEEKIRPPGSSSILEGFMPVALDVSMRVGAHMFKRVSFYARPQKNSDNRLAPKGLARRASLSLLQFLADGGAVDSTMPVVANEASEECSTGSTGSTGSSSIALPTSPKAVSNLKEALSKNSMLSQLLAPRTCLSSTNTFEKPCVAKVEMVAFQFSEDNPGAFFHFPADAVIEKVNIKPPFEVLVMFRMQAVVPNLTIKTYNQEITMTLSGVPTPLYTALQSYTKDPSLMLSELSGGCEATGIPRNIAYKECGLPFEPPAGLTENLYRSPKMIAQAMARKSNSIMDQKKKSKKSKSKKTKPSETILHDGVNNTISAEHLLPTTPNGDAEYEISDLSPLSDHSDGRGGTPNGERTCSYCSTRATPMWRRGPEGAGTLCNACGVKWKHGKIMQAKEAEAALLACKKESTSNGTMSIYGNENNNSNGKIYIAPLKKRKFMPTSGSITTLSKISSAPVDV